MPSAPSYPLANLDLARRLERTEGLACASFVEARAQHQPGSGAVWTEVAGTYAMFDGVGSPITQTFGLGLFGEITDAHLEQLEAFFRERGSDVFHEVSPLAGVPLLAMLVKRGYQPVEVSNVLFRPTALPVVADAGFPSRVQVRQITPDEADLWARISTEGWVSEVPELAEFMLDMGQITARNTRSALFLAEIDGQPISAGALNLGDGVALMGGASTIPAGRRQGGQRALFEARLRFATEQGYPLAMVVTEPGSTSQQNAERQGFRIAYTRTKWHLAY